MKKLNKPIFFALMCTFLISSHAMEEVLVKTRIDRHHDFKDLDHFCLHPMNDAKSQHLLQLHPEMKSWITESVTETLTNKGYEQVASHECTLEVAYEVKIRNQALLHSSRITHSDVFAERVDLIPERTVILHAHDLHFDKLIWIGTAEEAVFDSDYHKQNPEVVRNRLEAAIEKMFRRFPSNKS